ARQRFKHVVGFSYNEVSRRYVDDEPEFYEPEVWRKRADHVKQGSSDEPVEMGHRTREAVACYAKEAVTLYNELLRLGTAPEQARMVLPQSMLTSYYVTGSLAAFARAYTLRTHETAQREIQDLAKQWDAIIRPLFPVAWGALTGGEA
ncbi:FAD-dependent thymidylate synthase, partial [Camelimonas abortus]